MSLVDKFFTERRDDYNDLTKDLVTADFTPKKPPVSNGRDPRLLVQIPVHPSEPLLIDALDVYLRNPVVAIERLMVLVLINGTFGDGWENIFEQVRDFVGRYPDFPLRCFVAMNEKAFSTIAEVRLCLAMLALRELNGISDDGLSKTIFVSHDADMRGVAPYYFQELGIRYCDPDLHALGGGVKFESDDPILLLLLKIEDDIYRAKLAAGICKPKFCGANSTVRASSYVLSGGHNRSYKRKENVAIRESLIRRFGNSAVAYDDSLWISTSDRREAACLRNGNNLVHSRLSFGNVGDYGDDYFSSKAESFDSDVVPAREFDHCLIASQLTAMLWKEIDLFCASMSKKYRKKQNFPVEKKLSIIWADEKLLDAVTDLVINFANICLNNGLLIEFDSQYGVRVLQD